MSIVVRSERHSLPRHLERFRVDGEIDLTRPLDPSLSAEDRLTLLRCALAEGEDGEGEDEDVEVVFARLRAEFGY
jgi:hypothetical protein